MKGLNLLRSWGSSVAVEHLTRDGPKGHGRFERREFVFLFLLRGQLSVLTRSFSHIQPERSQSARR